VDRAIREGKSYDAELILVTHLGTEIWVRVWGMPEFDRGICTRFYGTIQDIDKFKRTELELENTRIRLENLLTNMDDVVYSASLPDYRLEYLNPATFSLYGYTPEEMYLDNDIWKKVKEHRIKDEGDFEWLKQTRFYWKSDVDHAIVSIADVDFTYSYEYLGVKERLVITPLTDRCYLTLSQALGICYGGAPAGPAGTGKTETVKDLSRTLGIACVVTNCSDQHRSRDMASIFKGTCSGGVWSCFDEFNRIELEVLSVVAMQIEAITFAKKQHLKTFMFPGERAPIKLSASTGYFITMNPGYAGRAELPDNLKILFRPVAMMIPSYGLVA
jgi:dynein heavy chain